MFYFEVGMDLLYLPYLPASHGNDWLWLRKYTALSGLGLMTHLLFLF